MQLQVRRKQLESSAAKIDKVFKTPQQKVFIFLFQKIKSWQEKSTPALPGLYHGDGV